MKKIISLLPPMWFITLCCYSQNVGIGISTPTRAKLEVHGAVDATSAIFGGEGTGISLQRSWPAIGFNHYWNAGDRHIFNGHASKIFIDPNSGHMALDMFPYNITNALALPATRALTISPGGYIGLGGAPTNAQLQFPNTIANRKILLYESANNDHQYYGFGINGGTLRYQVDAPGAAHRFYAGTGTGASNLIMSLWGDKKVLISNSGGGGFLGINLDSAPYTLSIKQAGGTGIYLQEAGSETSWEFRAVYYPFTGAAELMLRHNNIERGFFRTTGEYVWYSDSKLKTQVQTMPDLLGKVMQLRPVIYEMKKNNPGHEKTLGFIAQEVKPLFPELVFISEDKVSDKDKLGNLHALSYSGFGVLAIKAIQEQQKQIEELRNEIRELRKLIRSKE